MEYYRIRISCELPTVVLLGKRAWLIALSYGEKFRYAALIARSGKVCGAFVEGRTRDVEAALTRGIEVPVGTMRDRLAAELVRTRRAVKMEIEDDDGLG